MAFLDSHLASEPTFVFHHIPKTAGTTFMSILHNWFNVVSDYEGLCKSAEDFRMHPVYLKSLNSANVLAGHWNTATTGLDQRYPNLKGNRRFNMFTFLRDPLEMHISLFNYRWKMNPEDCSKHSRFASLKSYLNSTKNRVATLLGCDSFNYTQVLDRYYFIGITEEMEKSLSIFKIKTLDVLAKYHDSLNAQNQLSIIKNKSELPIQRLNVVERRHDRNELSASDLEYFKERNSLDYKIYQTALEKIKN